MLIRLKFKQKVKIMNINSLSIPSIQINRSATAIQIEPGHIQITQTTFSLYKDGLITIMILFEQSVCKHQANLMEFLLTGRISYGFEKTKTEALIINHLTQQKIHLLFSTNKMTDSHGPIFMRFKICVLS